MTSIPHHACTDDDEMMYTTYHLCNGRVLDITELELETRGCTCFSMPGKPSAGWTWYLSLLAYGRDLGHLGHYSQ
jgi:hypothetical protein